MKKNGKNHSYHQFYPVLAKIPINRGLLHLRLKIARWTILFCKSGLMYFGFKQFHQEVFSET